MDTVGNRGDIDCVVLMGTENAVGINRIDFHRFRNLGILSTLENTGNIDVEKDTYPQKTRLMNFCRVSKEIRPICCQVRTPDSTLIIGPPFSSPLQ